MQKKILIEISPEGVVKIDAVGFTGKSCSLATRELELALAGDMSNVDDKKRPEFWQSIAPTQTLGN